MQNKIEMFRQALSKQNVDQKNFLVWMAQGINSYQDYDSLTIDQLIKINIEFEEDESGIQVDQDYISQILDIHIPMFKEETGLDC